MMGFCESKIPLPYWFYRRIQYVSIGFMSQRGSGYARKALDNYETPDWVTKAVVPTLAPSFTSGSLLLAVKRWCVRWLKLVARLKPLISLTAVTSCKRRQFSTATRS
jgi:hypothetical protein